MDAPDDLIYFKSFYIMIKHANILRWLSLLPVAFVVSVLSDWAVRLLFWFIRLPIVLLEKIGIGPGPIGNFMDRVTGYFIGLDSDATLIAIVTGILFGYTLVYSLAIVAPTNNKKTAQKLVIFFMVLVVFELTALAAKSGINGENILWAFVFVIGILIAQKSIRNETEEEAMRIEEFIQKHIKRIIIATLLFTLTLVGFFLIA